MARVVVTKKLEDVPTRVEVRQSIKTLHMRASDFEMGGMTEMAEFDRNVAAQMARLLVEVETLNGSIEPIGQINAGIREELHEVG